MNANKRTKNSPNMSCSSSVHTDSNPTKEIKSVLQQVLHNIEADMECTKKSMEFGRIMLSYSCDKMKSLESQISQMKSVIDNNLLKRSFSDDENTFHDGASIASEGTTAENASDNMSDNILKVNSSEKEFAENRKKKLKTAPKIIDRSTQTIDKNRHVDSSKTRGEQQASEDGSFNIREASSREKTPRCTTFDDVIISDDFIAIDSPEKGICKNRKRELILNIGSTGGFTKAQKTYSNLHADSSETEIVDLDVEPTTSSAINFTDEVDETDTEAVRMAVQRTKGILPSQNLLTFLLLSSQVDDPVHLANEFTKDTKMFYLQLVAFAFHLRNINETLVQRDGAFRVDRRLEEKLQILIDVFQAELNSEFE